MSTWFMWQHILKIAEHPGDIYCKTSLQNCSFWPLALRNLKEKEDMWNVQLIGILSMHPYSLPALVSFTSLKVSDFKAHAVGPCYMMWGSFVFFSTWGKQTPPYIWESYKVSLMDANKFCANSIQFIKFLQQKMKNSDLLNVLSFLYTSPLISNNVVLGKGFSNTS